MSRKRQVSVAGALALAFLLQIAVLPQFKLLGVQPDLLLVVAAVVAIQDGPLEGAVTGFCGGMLQDMVSPLVMGVGTLTKMVAAYLAGALKGFFVTYSILLPVLLVFLASMAEPVMHQAVLIMLGQEKLPPFQVSVIFASALYNVLVVFVVYPLMGRFSFPGKDESFGLLKAGGG
ncbi:MAG: rod shape-determining protein MreD [Actinobacteria bacterium]|nr:rod shape-determining protein MreD [Actinomycetota bacterium]